MSRLQGWFLAGVVVLALCLMAGSNIRSGLDRSGVEAVDFADSAGTVTDGAITQIKMDEWEQGRVGLERAPGDTVFRAWYKGANDSGYWVMNVDASGDTMALQMSLQGLTTTAEHVRFAGPFSQRPVTGRWKWYNFHEVEFYHATDTWAENEDISSAGTAPEITALDSSWVADSEDAVVSRLTWTYAKAGGSIPDTIDVRRTLFAQRGAPYYVIRYDVRHTNIDKNDSLRFTLKEEGVKVGNDANSNDLCWVPNYGNVNLRKDFLLEDIGYCVAFTNTGNDSDAADSMHLDLALKLDAGSGIAEFPAGFIVWNSSREIAPMDVAITDLPSASMLSLEADSIFLHAGDYAEPVDGGVNVFFRTPFITLTHEWQSFEYAVGRAKLVGDRMPPVFPEIVFSNGFVWKCPYTRKQ